MYAFLGAGSHSDTVIKGETCAPTNRYEEILASPARKGQRAFGIILLEPDFRPIENMQKKNMGKSSAVAPDASSYKPR